MRHPSECMIASFIIILVSNQIGGVLGWFAGTRHHFFPTASRNRRSGRHDRPTSELPMVASIGPPPKSNGLFLNNTEETSSISHHRKKLQGRLLKTMRKLCKDYNMLEEGDHIMVCVSGGKDSATLLYLLRILQQQLPTHFDITAVHVDQKQPGYDGTSLVEWLDRDLRVNYTIVEEDTYSIVVDKTAPEKSYCTVCSRLRRGILYTTAVNLQCNKIALGHHADDCLETTMLNFIHAGQLKAMPARYTSFARGEDNPLAVIRPLLTCLETDIADYARLSQFPILPCNLCSNQANLQRPQVKLLLSTLQDLNPQAKQNMLRALQTVRPSHLLDKSLREACGMDPITGVEEEYGNVELF